MGDVGDFLKGRARIVFGWSWLPGSRFWAMLGFLTYTVLVAVGSVFLAAYFIVNAPKLPSEAEKKVPQLKSVVAELKLGLAAEIAAREKDKEESKGRANVDRTRITKLEEQRQEDQKTIAFLQRENKRLEADFIKFLLAAGGKPIQQPAFLAVPNPKLKLLPKELRDRIEPADLSTEPVLKKPPCWMLFKGEPLVCGGDPNADSRQ